MVGCKQGGHIPDDELVMEHHPEKLQFAAVYTVDGIEYGHLEYTLRGSDPDVCEPVTISCTMLGENFPPRSVYLSICLAGCLAACVCACCLPLIHKRST